MRKSKLEELKGYIEELKVIRRVSLDGSSGFLTINQSLFCLNNGEEIIRERILKNGRDGSASIILPVTEDNQVVLVVEPRVYTKSSVGVGLPAGYIENDELPLISALRELREETGYVPKKVLPLISFYQDEGCSGAYNHSFLALDCKKEANQNLDLGEFIRYFECTYEEALELVEMGYINGGNAILTLEKAKQYIRRR